MTVTTKATVRAVAEAEMARESTAMVVVTAMALSAKKDSLAVFSEARDCGMGCSLHISPSHTSPPMDSDYGCRSRSTVAVVEGGQREVRMEARTGAA